MSDKTNSLRDEHGHDHDREEDNLHEATAGRDISLNLTDEWNNFASRVGSFALRPAGLSRDAVMFAAGEAAVRRANSAMVATAATDRDTTVSPAPQHVAAQLRLWRAAAVAMASTSIALGVAIVLRPEPTPRVVVVERALPPSPVASAAPATKTPFAPQAVRAAPPVIATTNTPRATLPVAQSASSRPQRDLASSEFVRLRQQLRERGADAALNELARMSNSRAGRGPSTANPPDEIVPDDTLSPNERSRRLMQKLMEESRL